MQRLYRATGLVIGLLLAHLTLVGSGYVCADPMPGMSAATASEMTDMAGMVGMQAPPAAAAEPGATEHDASAPAGDSCTLPWAPSGCTSMVPCAPHASPAYRVIAAADVALDHATPAWVTGTPASPVFSPDPPPPRV